MSDDAAPDGVLALTASRQLVPWMLERRISLAFTTYKTGKLFIVSPRPDGRLSVFERTFRRCMGLWTNAQTILLSSLYQVWRLENVARDGEAAAQEHDRVYVPRLAWTTGDLDVHDLHPGPGGRPWFVNTLFSCIATVSERDSFVPLWTPPFISRLAAEDRCHLNGMAFRDGTLAYVSAVGTSDVADGWREQRLDGGVVVDVQANEVVLAGLCMPHSPRWHDGRLWLLNSGQGAFGYVDLDAGAFREVAFCPGYLRGLAFVGGHAVVGLSSARHDATFGDLPLESRLAAKGASARTGVQIVDLARGDVVHWLRLEGVIGEIYDVGVLEGVLRPNLIGTATDEICRVISIGDPGAAAAGS